VISLKLYFMYLRWNAKLGNHYAFGRWSMAIYDGNYPNLM
jgi:uncharacterized membrane protein YozB (DUF420 family)